MTNVEQNNANVYWRMKANEEMKRNPSLTFSEALAIVEARVADQIKAAKKKCASGEE